MNQAIPIFSAFAGAAIIIIAMFLKRKFAPIVQKFVNSLKEKKREKASLIKRISDIENRVDLLEGIYNNDSSTSAIIPPKVIELREEEKSKHAITWRNK